MLIPLKYFWMNFKILHFTTICSLNLSAGSFPQRKEEGTGMWIAERCSHSTGTRQASLRLSDRAVLFAPLGCCPHPPHPSSLRLACHWASILSQSSIYFSETFVRHWSTFCSLCCYKFIPLLWVLGRLNFIFEKSKRIEMKKKKKGFLPHSYWHTLKWIYIQRQNSSLSCDLWHAKLSSSLGGCLALPSNWSVLTFPCLAPAFHSGLCSAITFFESPSLMAGSFLPSHSSSHLGLLSSK